MFRILKYLLFLPITIGIIIGAILLLIGALFKTIGFFFYMEDKLVKKEISFIKFLLYK